MRLVSRLVEPVGPRPAVLEVLTRIAGTVSPRSAAIIKEQVYADQGRPVELALRAAANKMAAAFRAPDAVEGVRSFLEKRPARFPPYSQTSPAPTVDKENRS